MSIISPLIGLLPHILPNPGKRSIYLTALFISLSDINESLFDKEGKFKIVTEFNKDMGIFHDEKALEVPFFISPFIWQKDPVKFRNQPLSESDMKGLVGRIIRQTAPWSTYDKPDIVYEETYKVVTYSAKIKKLSFYYLPEPEFNHLNDLN